MIGVPATAPEAELSVNKGGRLPTLIEYVYGGTPPEATSDDA
jgi:hypothetical protein